MSKSDNYYLKHPRDQSFYHNLAIITNFCGTGKQKWWGYGEPYLKRITYVHFYIAAIGGGCILIGEILFFYLHFNELTFNTKGTIIALGPVTVLTNICQVSSFTKRFERLMIDFMAKIHICNIKDPDVFIIQERIKLEKITRYACFYNMGFLLIDWLGWTALPAVNNYINHEAIMNRTARYETNFYYPTYIDWKYDFYPWLGIHIWNSYALLIGCFIIIITTTYNFAFIFQIIGHIEIFKYRLQTIFKGDFTDAEIKGRLVKIIQHHDFILRTFKQMEDTLGFFVTSYYIYNLTSDSFNVYMFMTLEDRNRFTFLGMIVVYMGGLIMISFVLEEVKRKSTDISLNVYNIPWENWSVPNQKTALLVLMRATKVLQFTGMGGFQAGVAPMMSIIKTTFSFYVFLKSRSE